MLSISDWISFLSSEKNPNIGIIISFSALWLAVFAVFMSITNSTPLGAIIAGLAAIVLLIIYFLTIGPYGRRARIAGKLLNDIMSGEERDPSKIEERWKPVLAGRKRKNKKE